MVNLNSSPSCHWIKIILWLGLTALAIWGFIEITEEVLESSGIREIDNFSLTTFAQYRVPWLNHVVEEFTALGSITLIVTLSIVTFIVLMLSGDRFGAIQLVAALVGAGLWILIAKNFIGRARPDIVPHLIEVSGFSYPSGHSIAAASMYLTIAILVCRRFALLRDRLILLALAAVIICLVGLSRIYLGVHYPSDVLSGLSLGVAWAFLLSGLFSLMEFRNSGRQRSVADEKL